MRIIAVLRYIDHYAYPSCRTGCPPLAECRPKFISVTAWKVRFRECSTSSTRFNLCENCYNPLFRTSRRAKALGYARRSPPARARTEFKDHTPSAIQGEARLHRLYRIITQQPSRSSSRACGAGRMPKREGFSSNFGFHLPFWASGRPTLPLSTLQGRTENMCDAHFRQHQNAMAGRFGTRPCQYSA